MTTFASEPMLPSVPPDLHNLHSLSLFYTYFILGWVHVHVFSSSAAEHVIFCAFPFIFHVMSLIFFLSWFNVSSAGVRLLCGGSDCTAATSINASAPHLHHHHLHHTHHHSFKSPYSLYHFPDPSMQTPPVSQPHLPAALPFAPPPWAKTITRDRGGKCARREDGRE